MMIDKYESKDNLEKAKDYFFLGLENSEKKQYDEAINFFLYSLELAPKNKNTLINLSVVLLEYKKYEQAEDIIDKAISIYPSDEVILPLQARLFEECDRINLAIKVHKKIIDINPKNTESKKIKENLIKKFIKNIILKYQDNKIEEALSLISEIILLENGNPYAYNIRANIYADQNLKSEALTNYKKAIEYKNNYSEAYHNCGVIYEEMGNLEEASFNYKNAIKYSTNNSEAFYNLGNVQKKLNRLEEALENYEKAIELNPKFVEAHFNKGNLLIENKNWKESIVCFQEVINLKIDYAEAYYNLGNVYEELHLFEVALHSYEKAIKYKPKYAQAWTNKGVVLEELRIIDEALVSYDKAIELENDYAPAYHNKALLLLLNGEIKAGFKLYEWRWLIKDNNSQQDKRVFSKPLWLGKEKLNNKIILIHSEQGLGDTIQFCRYIPLLKKIGAKVIFEIQSPLKNLLKNLEGVNYFITSNDPVPFYEFHCPLLSLPLAFNTCLETIPVNIPYLQVSNQLVDKWSKYLGNSEFKIAICWQGSAQSRLDYGRSFQVTLFEKISQIKGVRLISIQKNCGTEQLENLPADITIEKISEDFDIGENAFLDTAAIMKSVDLIITSDTSLSHLAGALGLPNWLLLKRIPDWRWMLDRSDSPWYPNHKLFRQKKIGDWLSVFDEVENEIKLLISNSNS